MPLALSGAGPEHDPILMDSSRYLPFALAENPLLDGAARIGWAAFPLRGIGPEMTNPKIHFILTFEDKNGTKITADYPTKQ